MTIDRWRGTAKIEIDAGRRQRSQLRRVFRQAARVTAQELNGDRRTRMRAAASGEFGTDPAESTRWQQAARDADELADRQVIRPDPRQHVAQNIIDETLHRCQQQFSHVQPRPFFAHSTGADAFGQSWNPDTSSAHRAAKPHNS
jgi:hypothetical protein